MEKGHPPWSDFMIHGVNRSLLRSVQKVRHGYLLQAPCGRRGLTFESLHLSLPFTRHFTKSKHDGKGYKVDKLIFGTHNQFHKSVLQIPEWIVVMYETS